MATAKLGKENTSNIKYELQHHHLLRYDEVKFKTCVNVTVAHGMHNVLALSIPLVEEILSQVVG